MCGIDLALRQAVRVVEIADDRRPTPPPVAILFPPLRLLKLNGSDWSNTRELALVLLLLRMAHTYTIRLIQAVLRSRLLPIRRLLYDLGGTVALRNSLSVILQILLQLYLPLRISERVLNLIREVIVMEVVVIRLFEI